MKKWSKKLRVGRCSSMKVFQLGKCSSLKKPKRKRSNSFNTITSSTDDVISNTEKLKVKKNKKNKNETPHPPAEITPIKAGDRVNIRQLLFTEKRDYLIRFIDNQYHLVKAEQLEGKVIVITFVSLNSSLPWEENIYPLIDIYNDIHHKCPFEVVLVACADDADFPQSPYNPCQRFVDVFSCMPWTAIPYSDVTSRERLGRSFGIPPRCFPNHSAVIDPTGLVLQCHSDSLFSRYGSLGYPFSYERLRSLIHETNALRKHPSITNLLTSSERDYVISNNGDKVPILSLENKVVALHFYQECESDDLTLKLKRYYKQLVKNQNFEVVLIYLHDLYDPEHEDSFWNIFKTMPWLALPHKDPIIKKLKRFCRYPLDLEGPAPDPRLVIIGPRAEYFEPFGTDILMNYGIQAYPFTSKRIAQLEARKAKKVRLEMLWGSKTVLRRKDGSKVEFSEVAGKRIILLLGGVSWAARNVKFLTVLESKYKQMKDTDNEFEVIHIIDFEELFYYNKQAADVPWLLHPPFDKGSLQLKLLRSISGCICGLLAFDCNEQVVRKTMYPYFEEGEDTKFPFYDGDLEKEIVGELYTRFEWKYWGQ